jgi:hypothetical protein
MIIRERNQPFRFMRGWILFIIFTSALCITHPGRLLAQSYDRLGYQWEVAEQGWTGVWTRRANSNHFDARWTMQGQSDIEGVIEMKLSGGGVRMTRTDMHTNQRCEYQGQIARDGRTAQGWVSCNNGPRIDWSANIYSTSGMYQGNHETHTPPSSGTQRRETLGSWGPIIPKYNQGGRPWLYDLTGVWRSNDGGTYYVRQIGSDLWWYGEASNGQWSNIFHGAIDGEWADGMWLDVPKGRDRSNGALRLHIDSLNEFHREQKTGDDFGGSSWKKVC